MGEGGGYIGGNNGMYIFILFIISIYRLIQKTSAEMWVFFIGKVLYNIQTETAEKFGIIYSGIIYQNGRKIEVV